MRLTGWAISILLIAVRVLACEALQPKNPVKTEAVWGRAEGPDGQPLADFELRLVQKDQTLVSEVYTDASGNFSFPQLPKGDYFMATTSKGWWPLGWPVRVTDLRASRNCNHPLTVRPSLVCGGSISQKGYHPRF